MKMNNKKNQTGQFLIEALLIMFIFAGLATLVMSGLRDRNFFGNMVGRPWAQISGMMETGHWESFSSAEASGKLPHQRATSRESDEPNPAP